MAGGAADGFRRVYPINFAADVFWGYKIKEGSGSTCVKHETGVDAQESMTLFMRTEKNGGTVRLHACAFQQAGRN